jgi:predicted transcriptional regulator
MIDNEANYIELATDIVAAYVSNNTLQPHELPALINEIYTALLRTVRADAPALGLDALKPAISPKKSVTSSYIICLEDGKKFKSLKRHLKSVYNMSPAEYRAKWNLPSDYPMVAPSYSEKRSSLANKMGLGRNTAASKYKDSLH